MSWFADLAGKAESLLTNLDEQTGAALRNHNSVKSKKYERTEYLHRPDSAVVPKKKTPRTLKKVTPVTETKSNFVPSRKTSPTAHHQSRSQVKDTQAKETNCSTRSRKSPLKKPIPQYTLHNSPMTMVGDLTEYDMIQDQFGLKHRRFSLPSDLEMMDEEDWSYKMQNLEVENAMMKNELNVTNREVADLLDRLRKTEDGNDVDSAELRKSQFRLENSELLNRRVNMDKDSLTSQLELVKEKVNELTSGVVAKTKEQNQALENEVTVLKSLNKDLEERCKDLADKASECETTQIKLETELRHAHSTINDLQSNLEKSTQECVRLEKDWEAYKLRVKSMLHAKDNEIKSLQEGANLTEDAKVLMEHIDRLKEERDELSESISRVRNECSDMKQYMGQLESRHGAAERVVVALRDALRDERAARNRADAHAAALNKELKTTQLETGQTIASLRTALRDKDNELSNLRETSSTVRTTDTSALNVGDYDMQDTIDNDKIHYLTKTLVQRQGKIDNLLAQNNMLRIQLEKLESKYKSEVTTVRTNYTHSVVHLQDDCRPRARAASGGAGGHLPDSSLSALSMRMGVMVKRYPVIRICVFLYMICLHFWVITVLFTNTPQDFATRPAKS